MHDIGLLEIGHGCDVGACVGDVDLEKVLSAQPVGQEDDSPFPKEVEGETPALLFHSHHRNLVGLSVAHNHLGADSVLLQCLH